MKKSVGMVDVLILRPLQMQVFRKAEFRRSVVPKCPNEAAVTVHVRERFRIGGRSPRLHVRIPILVNDPIASPIPRRDVEVYRRWY